MPARHTDASKVSSAHHDSLTSPPHSPLSFSSSSHSTLPISLCFHRAATLLHVPSHPPSLLTPLSRPSALAHGLALAARASSGAGLLCGLGLTTTALHTPGGSSHNALYSTLLPPRSALSLVPHPFTRSPPDIPSHTGAFPRLSSPLHCSTPRYALCAPRPCTSSPIHDPRRYGGHLKTRAQLHAPALPARFTRRLPIDPTNSSEQRRPVCPAPPDPAWPCDWIPVHRSDVQIAADSGYTPARLKPKPTTVRTRFPHRLQPSSSFLSFTPSFPPSSRPSPSCRVAASNAPISTTITHGRLLPRWLILCRVQYQLRLSCPPRPSPFPARSALWLHTLSLLPSFIRMPSVSSYTVTQ
jgi:hypothetical protein